MTGRKKTQCKKNKKVCKVHTCVKSSKNGACLSIIPVTLMWIILCCNNTGTHPNATTSPLSHSSLMHYPRLFRQPLSHTPLPLAQSDTFIHSKHIKRRQTLSTTINSYLYRLSIGLHITDSQFPLTSATHKCHSALQYFLIH